MLAQHEANPVSTAERTLSVPVIDDAVLEDLDETFRVELSNAVETTIADGIGVGTILDDELCRGPNLLVNPSAELRPEDGEVPGWARGVGDWQRAFAPPAPVDGQATFCSYEAAIAMTEMIEPRMPGRSKDGKMLHLGRAL